MCTKLRFHNEVQSNSKMAYWSTRQVYFIPMRLTFAVSCLAGFTDRLLFMRMKRKTSWLTEKNMRQTTGARKRLHKSIFLLEVVNVCSTSCDKHLTATYLFIYFSRTSRSPVSLPHMDPMVLSGRTLPLIVSNHHV